MKPAAATTRGGIPGPGQGRWRGGEGGALESSSWLTFTGSPTWNEDAALGVWENEGGRILLPALVAAISRPPTDALS